MEQIPRHGLDARQLEPPQHPLEAVLVEADFERLDRDTPIDVGPAARAKPPKAAVRSDHAVAWRHKQLGSVLALLGPGVEPPEGALVVSPGAPASVLF